MAAVTAAAGARRAVDPSETGPPKNRQRTREVREGGLEPPRPFGHQDLNLTRLPNYATRARSTDYAMNKAPPRSTCQSDRRPGRGYFARPHDGVWLWQLGHRNRTSCKRESDGSPRMWSTSRISGSPHQSSPRPQRISRESPPTTCDCGQACPWCVRSVKGVGSIPNFVIRRLR